jgi:hypothetical protein
MKTDRNRLVRFICLGCALFLINGLVFLYYQNTVSKTGGMFVYHLDDTYIHLAIAKNAAFYGNWGVTRNEFTSCSSAPAYTALIGFLMKLFGDNEMLPLAVNLIFGNLIILALYAFMRDSLWFLIMTFFLCVPVLLHLQILSGMEHTMHIFVILAAFMLFLKCNEGEFRDKRLWAFFLVMTSLLCLTRYESMFFVVPVLVVLLLNKRYVLTAQTFTAGFLPVLLFGLWSISKGGFFFPNSLLMKGTGIIFSGGVMEITKMTVYYTCKLYYQLFILPMFMVPVAVMLIIIVKSLVTGGHPVSVSGLILTLKKYAVVFIPLTTILLHALFSTVQGQWRYEGYWLSLLYLALIILIREHIRANKGEIVTFAVIFSVFALPGIVGRLETSHRVLTYGGKNIHDQQIQMAKFLNAHYNDAMVMANDIGAICYYTNIKLKDLVGLGSTDVLIAKKEMLRDERTLYNNYRMKDLVKAGSIDALVIRKMFSVDMTNVILQNKRYNVIMVYDNWFKIKSEDDYKRLGWTKVGRLEIEDNVICGGPVVSFYSSDETMAEDMRNNMVRFFSKNTPADVGIYVYK